MKFSYEWQELWNNYTWWPWQQTNAWKATQYHEWQELWNKYTWRPWQQSNERLCNITSDRNYETTPEYSGSSGSSSPTHRYPQLIVLAPTKLALSQSSIRSLPRPLHPDHQLRTALSSASPRHWPVQVVEEYEITPTHPHPNTWHRKKLFYHEIYTKI